jgi:hypothetical protein
MVFPAPAPPLTSVGRPLGNPPPVISSKPWIPVSAFGSVLEDGRLAFFCCVIWFVLARAIYDCVAFGLSATRAHPDSGGDVALERAQYEL